MSVQYVPSRAISADAALALEEPLEVDNAVTIRDPVYISSPGLVSPGRADDVNKSRIIGFALTTQATGETVTVRKCGSLDGFSGLTENVRIFVDPSGGITQVAPVGINESIVQLGIARSATRIDIDIQQLVRRGG